MFQIGYFKNDVLTRYEHKFRTARLARRIADKVEEKQGCTCFLVILDDEEARGHDAEAAQGIS
jgi:DNA-binding IclR family transcriptional regulator